MSNPFLHTWSQLHTMGETWIKSLLALNTSILEIGSEDIRSIKFRGAVLSLRYGSAFIVGSDPLSVTEKNTFRYLVPCVQHFTYGGVQKECFESIYGGVRPVEWFADQVVERIPGMNENGDE